MHLKQKQTKAFINFDSKKQLYGLFLLASLPLFLVVFIYLLAFFQTKDVKFQYGQDTCVQQVTFLPELYGVIDKNSNFTLKNSDIISIGDWPIVSLQTCFIVNEPPVSGQISLKTAPFSGWFANRTYNITVSDYPSVKSGVLLKPVSAVMPLVLSLSEIDAMFDYSLIIGKETVDCSTIEYSIYCDIGHFNLLHAKEYKIKINRSFDDQFVSTVLEQNIETISATSLIESSVKSDQIIYNNPKAFDLVFNKNIVRANILLQEIKNGKATKTEIINTIKGKTISVSMLSSLKRNSSYRLTVENVLSDDSSSLAEPKVINFTVSGGPKISWVSIGSIDSPLSGSIVLGMDQALKDGQDMSAYVKASGASINTSYSGGQVYITYSGASMCTNITINVYSGLKSKYDIAQDEAWSFTTRTTCHTVSTIGYSKEGRSILAYTFGSGNQSILYTGSIHGNEASTKYLMDEWINELEINYDSIPSDKKIVVVPIINPDGIAANRRNNSNNVDLNRNFLTNDWQTDVFSPANLPVLGGGGLSPMSEPESQAIANLTVQLRPRLTLSFHSSAGYVIGNQSGDSAALALIYSNLVGYSNMTGVGGAFSYPITGTYDDWMREAHGLTSVLVELSSSYYSEFSRNKDALWAMARS